MQTAEVTYEKRVEQQIKQFAKTDNIHGDLREISRYWKSRFVQKPSRQIFGVDNHFQFYARPFQRAISRTKCPDLLSIGCGDGSVELRIAKMLHDAGVAFQFHLLELSPILLGKAERNIAEAGLSKQFEFYQVDLNTWVPATKFAGVMAHHSLHHIENLEHVFDAVKSSLLGYFCTMDMIGRNGHMRWPEVLELVQLFWAILPLEKRKHYLVPGFEKEFLNRDCSTEGFEGIRAQDILPTLVDRFGFEGFFAYGGLIDPFVARGFGHHYDPNKPEDRALIDLIAALNDLLIDLGHIKPTQMSAVMTPEHTQLPRTYRGRTPAFCIRWPGAHPSAS